LSNDFIVDQWKAVEKSKAGDMLRDLCAVSRVITKVYRKNGKTPFTPGQLAGVLFKLNAVDEKATAKFIDALENRKGNAKVLAARLVKIAESGRINDVGRAGMIVKAWEATCDGNVITAKDVNYDPSTEDFPLFGTASASAKLKLVA
jgi:predicted metal-dependent RNase